MAKFRIIAVISAADAVNGSCAEEWAPWRTASSRRQFEAPPVVASLVWAALLVGKVEEPWGSRMWQGRAGGGHQAADGAEVLTLGFGQRGRERLVDAVVGDCVLKWMSRGWDLLEAVGLLAAMRRRGRMDAWNIGGSQAF